MSTPRRLQENLSAANLDGTSRSLVSVNVVSHSSQKYSAWLGGSIVASESTFQGWVKSKEQYEEEGPKIMRNRADVYNADM